MNNFECGLVVGANGGLGFGLLNKMLEKAPQAKVYATYRNDSEKLFKLAEANERVKLIKSDPLTDTASIEEAIKNETLDFVIIGSGVLNKPEKSLREIELDNFEGVFKVNTFLPMIVTKLVKNKMNTEGETFLLYLSAMVGSIGENSLGGWYSYRASKAALNMCVKNVSLEFSRSLRLKKCKVVAMHPGTTHTNLTKGFTKNVKHKVWQPLEASENILKTLEKIDINSNKIFYNWDGRAIDW